MSSERKIQPNLRHTLRKIDVGDANYPLEAELSKHIIGQDEALRVVAREIAITEAGMGDPTKPKSVLLFAGQTGVGKTETTEALAKVLFKDEWKKHYLRIDCNQLQHSVSSTRISGASPNYVGYGDPPLITDTFLNQKDGTVIVFDEIEKAHYDIWKLILTITDKAELTAFLPTDRRQTANSRNSEVSPVQLKFNNSIIIFTTNAGAEDLQNLRTKRRIGFVSDPAPQVTDIKEIAMGSIKKTFSSIPEFLGRIGEQRMVVFNNLEARHYSQIFDNLLQEVNARTSRQMIVGEELKDWIIKQSISTGEYGARDLKHAIQQYVVSEVAKLRLSEAIQKDTKILIDRDPQSGEIIFYEEGVGVSNEVDESEEEEISPIDIDIPKTTVDFRHRQPFRINPVERRQYSVDHAYVASIVRLSDEKGVVGRVKIILLPSLKNFHGNNVGQENYKLVVELDRRSNKIIMDIEGKIYYGVNILSKRKHGTTMQTVREWSDYVDKKPMVPVFDWQELKDVEFTIF